MGAAGWGKVKSSSKGRQVGGSGICQSDIRRRGRAGEAVSFETVFSKELRGLSSGAVSGLEIMCCYYIPLFLLRLLVGVLAAGGSAHWCHHQESPVGCGQITSNSRSRCYIWVHVTGCVANVHGRFQSSLRDTNALDMFVHSVAQQTASQLSHRKQRGRSLKN